MPIMENLLGEIFLSCILAAAVSVLSEKVENPKSKRLLLNDPDVLASRIEQLEQKVAALTAQYSEQHALIQSEKQINQRQEQIISTLQGHGSTYIRWGRTQCRNTSTELIYSGYAAGQRYEHTTYTTRYGGPANTLCLPRDPELSTTPFTNGNSVLYGTEYEYNYFAPDSQDNDMPCAVCRNQNTSSSIMIPGRETCYSGWTKEYQGILAGGHNGHSASHFICVDANPEYIPHGEKNEEGHLFYVVNIQCGSLPCPPYHSNHKVNCVVCSK